MSQFPTSSVIAFVIIVLVVVTFGLWWKSKIEKQEKDDKKQRAAILKIYLIRGLRTLETCTKDNLLTYMEQVLPNENQWVTKEEITELLAEMIRNNTVSVISNYAKNKDNTLYYKINPKA